MPFPTIHVPDDPADRPVRVRRTSRLLVVDRQGHVLLFRDSDLGLDPVPHWWITPGGGVDPGESDRQAAVRELWEETGLRVAEEDLIGPVARRRVHHGYSDVVNDQEEVFFGVDVDRFTPDTSAHTEEELACLVDHGWFGPEDLTGLTEPLWPADLATIVAHLEALRTDPGLPPMDLGEVEESTVPVEPSAAAIEGAGRSSAATRAARLLDAQVHHHLERLRGEQGSRTVARLVEDVLAAVGRHPVAELVDADLVAATIVRALCEVPGSPLARGVVDLAAEVAAQGPHEPVTLAELAEREQVEAFVDAAIALHPALTHLLDRLADSPAVGAVAARFMGRIVSDTMQANQELAGRVPGLGSLVSFGTSATTRMVGVADRQLSGLLGDSLGRGGTYAVRRLSRIVVETVRDPLTREALLQVWDVLGSEPILPSAAGQDGETSALTPARAAHDLVVTALSSEAVAGLVTALVHGFLDRFGGYTVTELLGELGIDPAELAGDLIALTTSAMDRLHGSGDLEALLRAHLEPFYSSPEVMEILS